MPHRNPWRLGLGLLLLTAAPVMRVAAQDAGLLSVGSGLWVRFHHGPNTFQLTPGASISVDWMVRPRWEVSAKAMSGALFGNAAGAQLRVAYTPSLDAWRPAIGISAQLVFGSTVFYYSGRTDFLDAGFPELTLGVALEPFRFAWGRLGISALDLVVGTDLAHPFRILVVDADLFRVFVRLGGRSPS